MVGVEAFIDKKFPKGNFFCTQFLYSPEFNVQALKNLTDGKKNIHKYELAENIASLIEGQNIDNHEVLLEFVKQPRKWLSFQLGTHEKLPSLGKIDTLLTEFGESGWYGPIQDQDTSRNWYVRTVKVPFYERLFVANDTDDVPDEEREESVNSIETHHIRWTVIAEVHQNYVSLSWNGFRKNTLKNNNGESHPDFLTQ